MGIPFSEFPGRHERHYRRRLDNNLFDMPLVLDDDELLEAQRLDHEELVGFVDELRGLVQQAVELKPNEESDVILKLKENLDRLYETSAGLADEQEGNQQAIRQLLAVVMRTVWAAAEGDEKAVGELEQEEIARTTHFDLLRNSLVADLLHPETLIEPDQLLPTLLSESAEAVEAAVQLFSPEQRALLFADAETLLQQRDADKQRPEAWLRLQQLSL